MNLAKLGLGAMNTAQYKLQTAAHNVNNAAVEGYNRQTVLTQSAGSQAKGGGYVGLGVETVTVSRSYDNFLFQQLVGALGQGAAYKSYANEINQLDTLMADRTVGISPAIEKFFASVNAVASEPADPAAREEMLGQANNLASQIRETNAYLDRQRTNINAQISTVVDQVNSYVERIHDANQQIVKARASATQHEPNDLLDQRDQLLKELNELVGVTVFEQDGNFSLAIGNGNLVLGGNTVFPLQAQPSESDPQRLVVGLVMRQDTAGNKLTIELDESHIRGGQLGGLIQYRQEMLDDVQNNLGRMAVGLAAAFNEVHNDGYDLYGNSAAGRSFFSFNGAAAAPQVIPSTSLEATESFIEVEIVDADALTASDYKVTPRFAAGAFEGYDLVNQTTGVKTAITDGAEIDGLRFTINGSTADATDSWTIQPTRNLASAIQVDITDPGEIAVAAESTATPGESKGVSNGEIGLALAQLQHAKTMGGETLSVTEAFSQIVNRIGVASQQNKTALQAQESLINQTYATQQQVSGVNLNEEYINIEQALEQYRAASRMIDVASTMFDTLLNMR